MFSTASRPQDVGHRIHLNQVIRRQSAASVAEDCATPTELSGTYVAQTLGRTPRRTAHCRTSARILHAAIRVLGRSGASSVLPSD